MPSDCCEKLIFIMGSLRNRTIKTTMQFKQGKIYRPCYWLKQKAQISDTTCVAATITVNDHVTWSYLF